MKPWKVSFIKRLHCIVAEFELAGGVAYADMLGRTNLVALVGGGQAPKFPDRNGE